MYTRQDGIVAEGKEVEEQLRDRFGIHFRIDAPPGTPGIQHKLHTTCFAEIEKVSYEFLNKERFDFSYEIICNTIRIPPKYWAEAKKRETRQIPRNLAPKRIVEILPLTKGNDTVEDIAMALNLTKFRTDLTPFKLIVEFCTPELTTALVPSIASVMGQDELDGSEISATMYGDQSLAELEGMKFYAGIRKLELM